MGEGEMYSVHPVVRKAVDPIHAKVRRGWVGVHGTLYSTNTVAAIHPGGKVWIEMVDGTDATELFETSHMNAKKATETLDALPKEGFYEMEKRRRPLDFELYHTFRERALDLFPTRESRRKGYPRLLYVWVATCFFSHWLLFTKGGTLLVTLFLCFLCAFTNTVLGGYGHSYMHQLRPASLFLDWNGLSTLEWLQEHVSSHHPFVNTPYDHDSISMLPFVDWLRENRRRGGWNFLAFPIFAIGEVAVTIQGYFGHRSRWKAAPRSSPVWMRYSPFVFLVRVMLHLSFLGVWKGSATLLFSLCVASFHFSYLAHLNHATGFEGERSGCFATHQLENTRDILLPPFLERWFGGSAILFLDRQEMHHLFPILDQEFIDHTFKKRVMNDVWRGGESIPSLHSTLTRRLFS